MPVDRRTLVVALAMPWCCVRGAQASSDASPREPGLVQLTFSVRDRYGAPVQGLTPEQLQVFENHQLRPVRWFASSNETPLDVAILIGRGRDPETFPSDPFYPIEGFLRRVLRSGDQACAIAFGRQLKLICPMTGTMVEMERALRQMPGVYDHLPRLGPLVTRREGTAVIDAVYWTASTLFPSRRSRRAVVVLARGQDLASFASASAAIKVLQSEDILVYALEAGSETARAARHSKSCLPGLAEQTGGRLFDLRESSLKLALEEIDSDLRSLYSLGYPSGAGQGDGSSRKIEVRVQGEGYEVRCRPGYSLR